MKNLHLSLGSIVLVHAVLVFCQSFDDVTSREAQALLRRRAVTDLRKAMNDTDAAANLAITYRYPFLVDIAMKVVNTTENTTRFDQTKLCKYIDDLLIKTVDFCGTSFDRRSPCYLSDKILKSVLRVCPTPQYNVTDSTRPARYRPVTGYFLLAVKVLLKTATVSYERSCIERGGRLNNNRARCVTASPVQNNKTFKSDTIATPQTKNGLFIVSLTGNIISLVSLLLLFITYVILEKYKTVPGKSTICLSLALIGANISQIVVAYLHDNNVCCIVLGVLLHWFFLSVFLWMSSLAYDYFVTFHRIHPVGPHAKIIRFRVYCLISFALPTIAVIVCLALDIPNRSITHYGTKGRCFVVGFWTNLLAFVVPIALLVSINISFLCFTINDIQAVRKSTRHLTASNRNETLIAFVAMKLSVLVGAAWVMAFVDGFVSNIVVKYIYTIIVTYQGLFVYVAFGYHSAMVKTIRGSKKRKQRSSKDKGTKESQL